MVAEGKTEEGDKVFAKDQTLRTNWIKIKIDKIQEDSHCGLCKSKEENSARIVREFNMLAQKE